MREYRGTSYDAALAHIKAYQKNRTSIQIDSSRFKLLMEEDQIFGTWCGRWRSLNSVEEYRSDVFAYNQDGSCTLLWPDDEESWKYAQSIKFRMGVYTPLSRWPRWGRVESQGGKGYIFDPTHEVQPKLWKCRTCRGYQWLGHEAEAILYELAWDSYQKWQHQYPCRRCEGLGKADYAKQNYWRYKHGMVILPDGTVDKEKYKELG